MRANEQIIKRIETLLTDAENILSTRKEMGFAPKFHLDRQKAIQWIASAIYTVDGFFGSNSYFYKCLDERVPKIYEELIFMEAVGFLRSVKEEIENDTANRFTLRVRSEVFENFLSQAEYLLEQGYHQPAAIIIGAVAEDGLRRLCVKFTIPLTKTSGLNYMNEQLCKKQLYTALLKSSLDFLIKVRNFAAHGEWDKFNVHDVRRMLDTATKFQTDFFS